MMRELSLHIMDIMQNSIVAGATLVELDLYENAEEDMIKFTITDNGCGMDENMVKAVVDPFTTGRTTRRVGLGIPLLKLAAQMTGGDIELKSKKGEGTTIRAWFGYHHIDREPLGDMAQTVQQIITSYEEIDFVYRHSVGKNTFSIDTREFKKILKGVSFKTPEVTLWILEYLKDNEKEVYRIS